jgi:HK97 family phage portal protein
MRELHPEVVDHRAVVRADVLREPFVERRDPKAATMALQWRHKGLPIVQDWNGDKAFRAGYVANVIAYRCTQIRANVIASTPLVAGRDPRKPRAVNDKSPIIRLLGPPPGGPAPRLSARKLLRWTIGQKIVTGRRAWEIETKSNSNVPVAFWPLVSSELREIPSEGGTEWFRLFEYGPTMTPRKLTPDQVFYGWDPSGTDFRKAESAIGAARYDLSLITLCDRYGMAFLENHAVPSVVITTTRFPDEASRRAFEQRWSNEFGGVDNAGRVHVHEVDDDGDGPVGDSIDVKVLGLSAKDARLIETRKEAMIELAISLGVPWSKLDASGRTFDNAEIEDRTFWEDTILPDMTDLVDDINMQLAPRFGDDVVWFDLSNVRALQRKVHPVTQSVGAPELLRARIMTINEARDDYGLDAAPDGDRFLTDDEVVLFQGGQNDEAARAALVELERRVAELEPVVDPPPPPALPPADRDVVDVESREADPELVEQRRATIWRATDAVASTIEGRWMRALRRLFTRQAEATVARLTGKRGRQALGYTVDGVLDETRDTTAEQVDAAALFDVAFWTAATVEVVEDLYGQAVGAALDRIVLTFDAAFDVEAPWVADMLASRANQLAGQVTQTTYDSIVAQLVDGVADGESIEQLAERIRGVFSHADAVRAERIARTEVISAYNAATTRGAEALPRDVVIAREWIATRDSRVRDSHAAADGQVQLVGLPFTVSGRAASYPGDPSLPASETVNCRCAVALLTPEDFAGLDRGRPTVDRRVASSVISLVPAGGDVDLFAVRRALEVAR